PGLGQIQRQRLLAQDVLPGGERRQRDLAVPIIRGSDDDRVQLPAGEQVLGAPEDFGGADASRRPRIGVAGGMDLDIRAERKAGRVDRAGHAPGPNHSDSEKLRHFNAIIFAAIARNRGSARFLRNYYSFDRVSYREPIQRRFGKLDAPGEVPSWLTS